MSGIRSGLAKLIRDKEPKAVYTHCYGHSLSLASMDAIKGSSIMKQALDCTQEIIKLIKFSPRRDSRVGSRKPRHTFQLYSSYGKKPDLQQKILKSLVVLLELLPSWKNLISYLVVYWGSLYSNTQIT